MEKISKNQMAKETNEYPVMLTDAYYVDTSDEYMKIYVSKELTLNYKDIQDTELNAGIDKIFDILKNSDNKSDEVSYAMLKDTCEKMIHSITTRKALIKIAEQ